ncbi:MAG: hypothetical protein KatS3mg011_2437 [Acidimicrobiia bacterium]|nr:MAG: hypothetical protein KatS3mg011_2432 [Acidimicrobiia bacterium]GIU93531.1 MAG: hypothetical protein KatS3mg011_2437 [Acidimicrobiia bacterium]
MDDRRMIRLNTDLLGGLFIGLFGAVGLVGSWGGRFNAWIFPRVNSIVILAMALALIVRGVVRREVEDVMPRENATRLVLPMMAGLVAYYFLFTRLGFVLTTTLLFGGAMFMLSTRRTWQRAVVVFGVAAVVAGFFYVVFGEVFYVPWPTGTWLEALGLGR